PDYGVGRMKQMPFRALIAFAVAFAGDNALAQAATNTPVSTAKDRTPAVTKETDEKAWSFSISASTYIVPDDQEYVQPTLTADRGWLHLETRYNYANLETGSVWVGYNFGSGAKLESELTPMLCGAFGKPSGLA